MLNAEAEGELATDLGAVEALCHLYPDEVPHHLDVCRRLSERRSRLTPRERAMLLGFAELAEGHHEAREEAALDAFLATFGGGA